MPPKRKGAASQSDAADKKAKTSPVSAKSVAQLFVNAKKAGRKPGAPPSRSLLQERRKATEEPWTSKHAPKSREALAVHKKKVQVSQHPTQHAAEQSTRAAFGAAS